MDCVRINTNVEEAGKIGFIIGCRLKLPSVIEAYKDTLDIDYIYSFLDTSKMPKLGVHSKNSLTSEKIVRYLKDKI